MNWLNVMHFFWHMEDLTRFRPFGWVGNWMEDFGLEHGLITFSDEIIARIKSFNPDDSGWRTVTLEQVSELLNESEATD